MDHTGITANCASCHNGKTATGKPATHIVTSAPCETCHKSTVSFAGARMDHTGITANCASCHNGKTATGKPATHIVTSAPCETCHKSTVSFASLIRSRPSSLNGSHIRPQPTGCGPH
jgi:deoxycytidylate deaminase